ncbi:hypothetical protein RLIN73S_01381 [Rhodanobacter lindaniclasticus]
MPRRAGVGARGGPGRQGCAPGFDVTWAQTPREWGETRLSCVAHSPPWRVSSPPGWRRPAWRGYWPARWRMRQVRTAALPWHRPACRTPRRSARMRTASTGGYRSPGAAGRPPLQVRVRCAWRGHRLTLRSHGFEHRCSPAGGTNEKTGIWHNRRLWWCRFGASPRLACRSRRVDARRRTSATPEPAGGGSSSEPPCNCTPSGWSCVAARTGRPGRRRRPRAPVPAPGRCPATSTPCSRSSP